jgi:hypothetical protein
MSMQTHEYLIIAGLILIIIYEGISYHLFRGIFFRTKHKPVELVDYNDPFYQSSYQWYNEIPKEDETITSYDGLKLHGVYIPSHDKKSNKMAVVIHGYKSKALDMVIIAKMYSDLGFKVLIIDQRGHGESEGNLTTVGYYESYDIKKWLHFISRSYGAHTNVLLHGVSMGASTAVLATRFSESKNVKTLVLDSCFTNFKETLRLSTNYPILRIFLPGISFNSYLFLKFFLKDINPYKQLKHTCIPTLMIHGTKDRVVTQDMTDRLYEQIQSDKKDILIVHDAKHAKSFEVDKEAYIQKVVQITNDVFNIRKGDIKYCQ